MKRILQKPFLKYLICFFLAGITFGAFAGVARCAFLVFDDRNYVVSHPAVQHGFSWNTVKWAFTTFDCSNWHPLTWLSHILDCQLYGLNPTGHHLTNLGFHIANTILLFLLFQKLTARLWPSAFVALMFGIHPMHVESVAWVSERKDVLSAFFFLLTLLAYVRYAEPSQAKNNSQLAAPKRSVGGSAVAAVQTARIPHSVFYSLSLLFCILSLLSKPMVVTLPFVLLLLDFWPLQRFYRAEAERRRVNALAGSEPGGDGPAPVGRENPFLCCGGTELPDHAQSPGLGGIQWLGGIQLFPGPPAGTRSPGLRLVSA